MEEFTLTHEGPIMRGSIRVGWHTECTNASDTVRSYVSVVGGQTAMRMVDLPPRYSLERFRLVNAVMAKLHAELFPKTLTA